jgi:E3 ubiquitin ligase
MLLGVGLLAVAVVGAVVAVHDWTLWNALRRVRPTSPERLLRAAEGGRFDGRIVAVAGIAGPGPGGPLRSTVNAEACVWHRHTVHRRHIRYRTTAGGGMSQRYSRRRRVADVASQEPFLLRPVFPRPTTELRQPAAAARSDATARLSAVDGLPERAEVAIAVRPAGLRVHRPVAGGVRILPALASEPFPAAEMMMGHAAQMYWHREWVLRPGVPLFVLAEVNTGGETLTLQRPAKGPHVVSTRTARWLRRRTAAAVILGTLLAAVAAPAGAATLIIHYV